MEILIAESSGFCFGVQRAVSICERAAAEHSDCVTLGPIIHNEQVVRELKRKGVRVAADVSEVLPRNTVIIRSHGAGRKEFDYLAGLGVKIIDATCPNVSRIHDIARNETRGGRLPVIIGERTHPEVAAISGQCDECEVFESPGELRRWLETDDNASKPVSLMFQTTNTISVYNSCADIVKKECTNHKIFDTICGATCKRQQEAEDMSKRADAMVVVGGVNSANSLRLAGICRNHCQRVFFIENSEALADVDIRASDTVGIISGASTPSWIIKEVAQKMSEEIMLDETRSEQEMEGHGDTAVISEDDSPMAELSTAENAGPESADPAVNESAAEDTGAAEDIVPADADVTEEHNDEPGVDASEADTVSAASEPEPQSEPDSGVIADQETAESEEPVGQDGGDSSEDMRAAVESFEEMLEKSIKTLYTGQKVTGVVTSITATEVSVDLGTKQSGYVPISEFTDDANTDIDDIIHVGDTIETFVMRVNDVEGMVMLSKKRLDAIRNWDIIEASKENRAIVEGTVTEENKGGIVVNVKGVRVFVPASQTGLPKSSPMTELIRKTVKLRITEVNQSRRRVVGSIRAVQADERRERSEKLWTEIEVGKQYDGVVKSMTSYGVFVDIGGVDGMIHISELSWTRIKQPSEVMSVGDEVSVYVLSFDRDTRKISLGYKKNSDNPWTKFTTNNAVGDIVNVKIVKLMPFGAFAEINPGVDGLIHISQITDHRIGLPSEVLTDGQFVDVKITEIDNDRKKVSLSIRALIDPSSQRLTDEEAAQAQLADNTPVIVYDTDSPPAPEEDDEQAPEPDTGAETPETEADANDNVAGGPAEEETQDGGDDAEAEPESAVTDDSDQQDPAADE